MTTTLNIDKSNWKKYRFDEVCRQVNESSKNPAEDGLVHVIGLEHIEPNNLHITQWDTLEKETTFTRKFVKGQVLFGRRRAYQRKVAYAEFDGICSGDILVFEAIKDKMVPELLPFLIQSDGFFAKALETSAGSLSPRTKFKELADYEFLLPPLAEQQRLAELLWAADEMIEKEKRELEGVERMLQTYFYEIESLNQNSNCQLSDIITLNYGKALKECDRISGSYDVVGSAGIVDNHNSFLVEGPGVVVGRKGSAGNVIWVDNDFWTIDTAFWVSLKSDNIGLRYAYLLLKSLHLDELAITTAVPGLNRDDVYEQAVYLPSTEMQNKYVNDFEKISILKRNCELHIHKSQEVKQEIINKIF